jgi:hypothetical protein
VRVTRALLKSSDQPGPVDTGWAGADLAERTWSPEDTSRRNKAEPTFSLAPVMAIGRLLSRHRTRYRN